MESSQGSRAGEISSHLVIVLVTAAQLVFFAFFHEYIAWPTTEPEGSVTRQSMLTHEYFHWLPIMVAASILVIITSIAMIAYDNYRFRKTAEISFNIIGIVVALSLIAIFPFDFSVIPNDTAADVMPTSLTVFFLLLAVFYAVTALVMSMKLKRDKT
jgi:hypothetical protein